jgi:twitching motility protein PilT
VANLIATGRSVQIYSAMETGTALGMRTMEQDLARLWAEGRISETVALGVARNPDIVRMRVQGLQQAAQNVRNGSGQSSGFRRNK